MKGIKNSLLFDFGEKDSATEIRVTFSNLRDHLLPISNMVSSGVGPLIVTRLGSDRFALVSLQDLKILKDALAARGQLKDNAPGKDDPIHLT